MESNEISMLMDVKLDIYDKRPESLKLKAWTKCEVKIEAIKCLPCFLRISFQSVPQDDNDDTVQLSVSINVPGVTISLATSRFKQHSYGLFWTHHRRDCFIYFALDTELSCRKHMKWIKKSIKNLELYRQVFLEQRRNSRGPVLYSEHKKNSDKKALSAVKDALSALGPLPQIPDTSNRIDWFRRVSQESEIYEEIFEENVPTARLSRRLSRSSIASGIYEEMRPYAANIHSIVEEQGSKPPPLPPLPPHRKRINTLESDPLGMLGELPRSYTNPESDLAKKKKYKNILGSDITNRTKRAGSVSETTACTLNEVIKSGDKDSEFQPVYANNIIKRPFANVKNDKRNSFSSPDLSKINFLDTFDEEKLAALLHLDNSSDLDAHIGEDFDCDDLAVAHNYSSLSLDESSLVPTSSLHKMSRVQALKSKSGSMENLNVSARLTQNFNFSACNTSGINLVGANGAVPSINKLKRHDIVIEDELSGYCVMAPIIRKNADGKGATTTTTSSTTSSTTSGYSTGSYSSSTSSTTSSNTQVTENKEQLPEIVAIKKDATSVRVDSFYDELPMRKNPLPVSECEKNNTYENLVPFSPGNGGNAASMGNNETTPTLNKDFTGNLYENLLTIKAAQELEQPLPAHICTSTPTESPAEKLYANDSQEQENIYLTPRKSLISIDDKVPSYYPNSCDTVKAKRHSPAKQTSPTLLKTLEKEKSTGLKNLVNIKMKRERKENLYISSPQKIIEQRQKSSKGTCSQATSSSKTKKSANAQKISDNVYTVNLTNKKSLQVFNNNNISDKSPNKEIKGTGQPNENLHNELLQIALLQKIDFKFDDTSNPTVETSYATTSTASSNDLSTLTQSGLAKLEQAEIEYENCYQATKDATRLLHKYATLAPKQSIRIKQQLQQHLQLNPGSHQKILMTQSTKLESPVSSSDITGSSGVIVTKKFASLPRFKKIDFSPLKLKINNVLQRNQNQDF